MMTKKKHKACKGHRYDFGQILQFMKDNPELIEMAGNLMQNQQGGGQQAPAQQQPIDRGVTGQKTYYQVDSSAPMIGGLLHTMGDFANAINSTSEQGNEPIGKVIGLPGGYYSEGGHLFDLGSGIQSIGSVNSMPNNYVVNTKPETLQVPESSGGSGGGMGGMSTASTAIAAADYGLSTLAKSIQKSKGVDTKPYEEQVRNYGEQQITANTNEDLLNAWGDRRQLKHVTKYDITGGTLGGDIIGGIASNLGAASEGAMTGFSIGGIPGAIVGTIFGGLADAWGQLAGAENTRGNINRLNRRIDVAMARQDKSRNDAALNIQRKNVDNMLANFSAFGGPIRPMHYGYTMPVMGATSYDIAKDNAYAKQMQVQGKNSTSFSPVFGSMSTFADGGGIHIAPSKRGTFTAAAKKHGKSVQEFASQVLANPDNYSPAMRKKANFARNAAKWHADGGLLLSDYFTNGVTLVDQGGTHENNPHEGVQMGIAPDGAPNLVEEGEAIYNDYVFSNRLAVPDEVRNKYKLRGPKDMTFAEAFREVQKESAERPNDPISQDGLDNMAMVLARTQEAIRAYERGHKKAKGGHLFSGEYDPNSMTPEEFYRIYGTYPVMEEPISAFTPQEIARINGNAASPEKPSTTATKSATKSSANSDSGNVASNLNLLRFAEPLANLGAVASDMMGLTNTPFEYDYIPGFQAVGYNPLGNYIPVTHFDTRYAANKAAQQAAATRNAIMQSTSPNKYAALLAADYNAQIAEGDLLRQAALDDYNMMVRREEFNRGTNQANSEMGLKAAMANQDAKLKYAQAALQEAKMNVDETNAASAARAANLSALAESVANIGREADARGDRNWLIAKGVFGTFSEDDLRNKYGFDEATIRDIKGNKYVGKNAACGGKIRRKKKGLTY